jgi:ubiquitin carboxyl-terminal hydrolase 14
LDHGKEFEKKKAAEAQKASEDRFELYKKKLEASGQMIPEDTRELYKKFKVEQNEEDLQNHFDQLYRKHGMGLETGSYELVAVLTHKGRSAESGHYVGWVHKRGGNMSLNNILTMP